MRTLFGNNGYPMEVVERAIEQTLRKALETKGQDRGGVPLMEMSRELSVHLTLVRPIHRIVTLIAYFFDYLGWA